jgi:cytoskeletal protein RodZ
MELMAAELRRQHTQMWYIVVAMGLVAAVTVGLLAGWLLHGQRRDNAPASTPVTQPQAPPSQKPAQSSPEQPENPAIPSSQPGQSAPAPTPKENSSGGKTSSNGIDVQAIQNAVSGMAQRGGQKGSSSQQTVTGSAARAASDRYPGSQPVDMKDAAIPDVGIPVSNQVYSTSDSLVTVMAYYKGLYPDAQVMEISGQNIIAVDRPGETKVIAIGTSGSETRIAIVQPGN